jgi:acetylornithine deacetylase
MADGLTKYQKAVKLLSQMIELESFSKEESATADLIDSFLKDHHINTYRKGNNIWCQNKNYQKELPTILLNSHHDTVKPNSGYTRNPFEATVEEGKLYGLGSNDAGGALVSLIMTFLHFNDKELPYNLILAATAEEEISGKEGVESILEDIGPIDFACVGEPTEMNMGVAEKGLMVLDCYVKGTSGHAARDLGDNAIYKAIPDIQWFKTYQFPKESAFLGPVKMTVTLIESGHQHNVIPDACHFVVDVRSTDAYSNNELLEIIRSSVTCQVAPRSTRLNPSFLSEDHLMREVADSMGLQQFGSATCSDQALMPFSSFKMGPGRSERSHSPDEFIYLEEIETGIKKYIELFETFFSNQNSPL